MGNPDFAVVSLRPGSKPAPEGVQANVTAPEWLTERGRTAWDRLAPRNVVTESDADEFAAFCESIAEYQEATELLAETGLVILDPMSGAPVPNPITSVRDRADRKIAFWANRFRG
ncbi:P27 family phage terminase small subunit [Rhodococcus erythropolis]|uniref:P27 family phage terminase small subunit n=1 Tax=Rhodococcus erythropolis TaxID=1833 RepID=UPI0024B93966|nr:P27 family phage terminase small subunit [Rhodococcus erythropolis]MDJ0404020.1 P27 family phage terminase small subunit [Rhodococcus erythropolis]